MQTRKVTVIGGAGFVGRHLARVLTERGVEVTVATRNRERAKRDLIILPTVEVVEANVHDDDALGRLITGADAVINLTGILHEARRGDFARVHTVLPERIAAACERAAVPRFLQMSALCADPNGPSAYLRSKGEGEARALAAGSRGLAVTVFRPSVIFGLGDSFLTLFATMQRFVPVIVLGSPHARFQPVWVEDVVRVMAEALDNRETSGKRYDLCGPEVFTLRELLNKAGQAIGRRRPVIGLSRSLSYLQALLMELSPIKVLTRDNVRSMSVDNLCQCGWPAEFAFSPASIDAVLPSYLGPGSRGEYDGFRTRARR
jgi:NADH dehydrogenase